MGRRLFTIRKEESVSFLGMGGVSSVTFGKQSICRAGETRSASHAPGFDFRPIWGTVMVPRADHVSTFQHHFTIIYTCKSSIVICHRSILSRNELLDIRCLRLVRQYDHCEQHVPITAPNPNHRCWESWKCICPSRHTVHRGCRSGSGRSDQIQA